MVDQNNPSQEQRWEDVSQKVADKFSSRDEFITFSKVKDGLCLEEIEVHTIVEDSKTTPELKTNILKLWKQWNGDRKPQYLFDLTDKYLSSANHRTDKRPIEEPVPDQQQKVEICPFKKVWACLWLSSQRIFNGTLQTGWPILGIFVVVVIAFCCVAQSSEPCSKVSSEESEPICHDYTASVESFIQKVNKATKDAANDLHFEELGNPGFDVFPETVVVNFYNSPAYRQGYIPEVDFTQVSRMGGDLIKMADFFNSTEVQRMRYVAVIGGVGYGKTEMLKRISRDVLSQSYPDLRDIKMVRLIYLRDLQNEGKLTAGDLLFGQIPDIAQNEIICGVNYIRNNPKEVLFVLDGLDQYPEKLGKGKLIRPFSKENPNKTLSSVLSGSLFSDARILLSAREHAIRHFESGMRPDRVVALSGFSLPSIENLVKRFGGTSDGERIWKHLQYRSPTLLSVSSIPMFMVFTVMVLKRAKESPPETSTEVLMHVLHYLETSNHAMKDIISIISKLKRMSFEGTKAGEVSFTKTNLPDNLTIDEVTDLLITRTGVTSRNQRLFDGHFRLSFCHQSLQEALAALFVAEMQVEDFRKFVKEEIHKPQWVIVRRMVCGLLLNSKTREVAQGNDPSVSLLDSSDRFGKDLGEKQTILLASLKDQLIELQGDGKQKGALLELMHALHECGESVNDIIATSTDEVNLLNMPLTKSDIHVLFSMINRCPKLTLLSLINCDFGDDDLLLLAETFRKSNKSIKVRILLLGNYEQVLSPKSAEAIRDMLKYVTDFAWLGYRIDDAVVDMFRKEVERVNSPGRIYAWRQDTKRLVILE